MACQPCVQTRYGVLVAATSTTRPIGSDLWAGRMIYETDTNRIMLYTGLAWIVQSQPWTTWTPVVTQSVAVAKTVQYAKYCINAGMVLASAQLLFTASGTANQIIDCSVPVTISTGYNSAGVMGVGHGTFADIGIIQYPIVATVTASTGGLRFLRSDTPYSGWFGSDPAMQINNTDHLSFTVRYEMA